MVLHEDGLGLLRADGGDMARMKRIGDVEQLDTIDTMRNKADVAADGDACSEFGGVETWQDGRIFAIMYINDPQTEVSGGQEKIIAVADHLPTASETCHNPYKLGLQRVVFNVENSEFPIGGRVEVIACTDHGAGSDGIFHMFHREDWAVQIRVVGGKGGQAEKAGQAERFKMIHKFL